MKHFILKENDIPTEEIDFSHKEEGYVIIKDETYYIDDKYIRKNLMDKIISYVKQDYDDASSYLEESDIVEPYYQNIVLEYKVSNILNEIRNDENFTSIFEYIEEYGIEEYEIKELLKSSIEFSIYKPNEEYKFIDDEIDSYYEDWATTDLNFNINLGLRNEEKKVKPINIYYGDENYNNEEYLTNAEINYLEEKIENIISKNVREELEEYKKSSECDNEIYFDVPYTVYQIINFITFKEKFVEEYPDSDSKNWKLKFKDLRKDNKTKINFPYPSREVYNDIQNFNINNNSIKKVITYLYTKNQNLEKKYNYKELNPLIKITPILKSGMVQPIKDKKTIIQLFPQGFTLSDLLELDSTLEKNIISDKSIFKVLKNSDLIIQFTKWNSPLQRVFLKETNHVFQLNIKNLEIENKIYDYAEKLYRDSIGGNSTWNIKKKVKNWQATTGHPVSRSKITLAWIRFTKINPDEIVMDEIQTDLDDEDDYFGKDLMDGWQDIILSKFIKFVKYNLHINKIYYPTYTTKKNEYKANPPTYLYSDLPKKYGFSIDNSELEGFMLLEKTKKENK